MSNKSWFRGSNRAPDSVVEEHDAPGVVTVGCKYTIGQPGKERVVTVLEVTEKAYIVTAEGAKKPWPIAKSKWHGKPIKRGDT